jgi:hypothetical protein
MKKRTRVLGLIIAVLGGIGAVGAAYNVASAFRSQPQEPMLPAVAIAVLALCVILLVWGIVLRKGSKRAWWVLVGALAALPVVVICNDFIRTDDVLLSDVFLVVLCLILLFLLLSDPPKKWGSA